MQITVSLLKEATAPTYSSDEMAIANRTSATGAVGAKAIVPPYAASIAKDGQTILDFGAGKVAMHAQKLKAQGLNVTAYEFGNNINPKLHDRNALSRKYDIVYASNVLNVQSTPEMMQKTLETIRKVTKSNGSFVANFPSEPRKMPGLKASEVEAMLLKYFSTVQRVGGTGSAPMWLCKGTPKQPAVGVQAPVAKKK